MCLGFNSGRKTDQCLHFQPPWSEPGTSTHDPNRSSPFGILMPSFLQTVSGQPARPLLASSILCISHVLKGWSGMVDKKAWVFLGDLAGVVMLNSGPRSKAHLGGASKDN